MLDKGFKELLSIFNEQKVKYLIVGGYAVAFHAHPRATKGLDLFIKADAGNAKAVYTPIRRIQVLCFQSACIGVNPRPSLLMHSSAACPPHTTGPAR
jgi:hypothetical protein